MIAMVPAERVSAAGEIVGSALNRTGIFCSKGPGSGTVSVRPRRSLIWLAKMMTAMPAVMAAGAIDPGRRPAVNGG